MSTEERPDERMTELERELASARALAKVLYDDSSDGIAIMAVDGSVRVNRRAENLLRAAPNETGDQWQESWGFFRFDGSRVPIPELGSFRAMRGERVEDEELSIRAPHFDGEILTSTTAVPLPGGGAIGILRDIGARIRAERELSARADEIAERDGENRALVERLRAAIDEIATPILRIAEGVLVVPIIGVLDPTRSTRTAERILHEVTRARARSVIIEVTGAELNDAATADAFARITRAVGLLGARCMVSGMRPAVARTLVELGVRLDRLPTYPSLKHALRASLEQAEQRGAA